MIAAVVILVVVLLLAGGAGYWFYVRAEHAARLQWDQAWALLESQPDQALSAFQEIIPRLKKSRRTPPEQVARAYFGAVLCLVKLKRFDEALPMQEEARGYALPEPEDQARLARTYLEADPRPLTHGAADAFARYLVLPEPPREAELQDRILGLLKQALRPASGTTPEESARLLELANRVLTLAPRLDSIHYAVALLHYRAERWEDAVAAVRQALATGLPSSEKYVTLGRSLRRLGQHREAREALLEAYQLDKHPVTAYEAGAACLQVHEIPFSEGEQRVAGSLTPLAFANELLQWSTQQAPSWGQGWAKWGEALWRLGRPTEAIPALERGLALDAAQAQAHYWLALCWQAQGDLGKAKAALEALLQARPAHREGRRLAADLAFAAREYAKALEYYQQLDAPDTAALDRMARCFLETGKPAQAVRLLAGRPSYTTDARLTLARAQARLGRWSDALTLLQGESPPTAEYRYYLAAALAATGRLAEAEKLFQELAADPDWKERVCGQLGHLKLLSGDLDSAQRCYASANGVTAAAFNLGRLHLVRQEPDAAREQFQKAQAGAPDNKLLRLGLALSQAQLGKDDSLQALTHDTEIASWALEELGKRAYTSRRFVDALDLLERAVQQRKNISSEVLVRLAMGYLQLGRHREALPHLVECSRRRPTDTAVRYNLGICRYHLGLAHFKKKLWEPARAEWNRAAVLLAKVEPKEASAIVRWELEAAFRAAVQIVTSERSADLEKASLLFKEGCERAATEPRWWFGAGIAEALRGNSTASAESFARARELLPDRDSAALGHGLSLQAADRGAEARTAFQETLRLTSQPNGPPGRSLLQVAARFALATSHASQQSWEQAAVELEPLLDQQLVRSSHRISLEDIAQVLVAYYGLAGRKERASELARKYLGQGHGLGDLLLGVVQAEAGDFAGAVETLESAYRHAPKEEVKRLLMACLLALAADWVQKGDRPKALQAVLRALKHDPNHAAARQLEGALRFAENLRDLNLATLDKTLARCLTLLQESGTSGQLVRTVAVLHHRKAIDAEKRGKGQDAAWSTCMAFWKRQVLGADNFWTELLADYNTGKGKREQLKPEELAKWRTELPHELARGHASCVAACMRERDKNGLKRHLKLILDWAADFQPPPGFLANELRDVDPATIAILEEVLNAVKAPEFRQMLGSVVAGHWANEGAKEFSKAMDSQNRGVELANRTGEMTDQAVKAINGLQIEQGLGMLRMAKSAAEMGLQQVEEARQPARNACDLLAKACRAAPDVLVFSQFQDRANKLRNDIDENARNITGLVKQIGDLVNQVNRATAGRF